MGVDLGVGLWSFQSTVSMPRSLPGLYRDFPAVARRVEELGYAHLWLAEHRLWYDGWCPAPLIPVAAAAGATSTLRFGTAVLLLPQHDPRRLRSVAAAVDAAARGRLELGVGLGHRDAEFDGVGLARTGRGRRMDAGLEVLDREPPCGRSNAVWVGGMATAALERIGRHGMSALLPQTLDAAGIRRAVDTVYAAARAAGREPGRIGMVKDVWVDPDGDHARSWFLPRLRRHYVEEAGAWWVLDGSHGFARPERLDKQVDRAVRSAAVGTPAEVAASVAEAEEAGVDTIVARINFDFVADHELDRQLELLASTVLKEVTA
ncbi:MULTISPECIES: LLM class flavin-dependent oxidoreductase [Prauserella salsuginis group]|uniref:Alkanesulfonate monooxygenase SsuD/methylene tetrahydromethanopterin reductase-like flavin-dependent oxidoreductase (Luciferase family) n=2 Tax=Prauserella salsuginis group TaxID=2893672 RepID=A0A839XYN7_9PSEU|nr:MULTISPECIES: LLM class flavin-dependent oxidoreductase [Prauserella salsuginis group]MBB3665533.1 alkanesulfonate monooxygenase SsuD/methylene tetrahydromethanopterin reductase-like flavin-dependent oxidoreductase (luciferase family) [Prauserella sediminis]MCR3718769.1 Flavin-dependent oxidoreductase, luciferase family (includes alkanesulfonate monooxygenase SsuD and methylene tetrahydromethanopterin reductase) [Prauserella flava]MCR3733339.1 Flavin-dependent oxidoreductase, luciferase famil